MVVDTDCMCASHTWQSIVKVVDILEQGYIARFGNDDISVIRNGYIQPIV